MKTGQNIILTGPPRSGTTLACHLLNGFENSAALHEPMRLGMFTNHSIALQNIQDFFAQMRTSILNTKTAIARVKEGQIPDNPFTDSMEKGRRKSIVSKGIVRFEKKFSDDFKLVIKHNAHFTFLLNFLQQFYPCYAVIRNPISTIASWNTIDAPVAHGNVKVLKRLDPDLYETIEAIPNLLDKQVRLLHEHFKCYQVLPTQSIIKYEDIIVSNGAILHSIVASPPKQLKMLSNRNRNKLYDKRLMKQIRKKLQAFDGAYHQWYKI